MIPGLTTAQSKALGSPLGNMQLIACAGSGKTEVVAQRITKLITPTAEGGGGLKPGNIVAFTFTEKAAAELKDRVVDRCREKYSDIVGLAEIRWHYPRILPGSFKI
jgi:ATP-dependent DNA helicase UvrD/PcrA